MSDVQELVALSSRILAAHGHGDLIWGHSSSRDADGRGLWIKSAEWGQEEVLADRVHLVGSDGQVVEGGGARHSEWPIHSQIYAARPDVGGVVHTHSPYAVALAASGQPLLPVSHAASLFVPPPVPCFTETSNLIVTAELGDAVARTLGEGRVLFLLNHGIVAVGPSVQIATVAAVSLERACRQQHRTATFGGWPRWTDSDESLAKRSNFGDQVLMAVWDYMVRTLPRASAG